MINCRGSASLCILHRLGEQSLSVSAGPGEVAGAGGMGRGTRTAVCALPGDPPQDRGQPPRARKMSGRRVLGGSSGDPV